MTYQRGKCLYAGKASELYEAADEHGRVIPDLCIINRKDDITAQDGAVRSKIEGKGIYTNRISNHLFRMLEKEDVHTHFVFELSSRETLIKRTTPLPLEVVVRNIATGSLCQRLPFTDGILLYDPIVELFYKSDAYHDPLINHYHAIALEIVNSEEELKDIEWLAKDASAVLQDIFANVGIALVDLKLEFGRLPSGELILIDEISPDTCRLWDTRTGQKLDKDIFRQGLGNDATAAAYREVYERLTAVDGT